MSYYSDENIKTKYVEPRVYVANSRAVFDLDLTESAYMPNLQLGFLGLTSTQVSQYNGLVGAASLIRSARLLDGKQVLSQLNEAQFYKGFQNQNKSNANAGVRTSNMDLSINGRSVEGLQGLIGRVQTPGIVRDKPIGSAADATNLATIDLRDYFPILNAIQLLPTTVFKNLRIEIEFNANLNNQVINNTATGIILVTQRPLLIVDCMINEETLNKVIKSMPREMVWSEVEHDQFIIPECVSGPGAPTSDGLIQNVDITLNGYNNKIVDQMLIVKEIGNSSLEIDSGSDTVIGLGKWSSQACFKQTVQFRVNGRNILPGAGIQGDNERQGYMVDTFGDSCGYPGSNAYEEDTTALVAGGPGTSGQLDYIGVYLGKQINNLQINYSRVNVLQSSAGKRATNALLIGHSYGAVRKQLNMMTGGYVVDYQQM